MSSGRCQSDRIAAARHIRPAVQGRREGTAYRTVCGYWQQGRGGDVVQSTSGRGRQTVTAAAQTGPVVDGGARVTVTLVVDHPPPPSLNRWQRMHWAARRRTMADWHLLLGDARVRAQCPRFDKAHVVVRFYHRGRVRDADNAIPKVLLDNLVKLGVLPDDNPQVILSQRVEQATDRKRPRVEIELAEG